MGNSAIVSERARSQNVVRGKNGRPIAVPDRLSVTNSGKSSPARLSVGGRDSPAKILNPPARTSPKSVLQNSTTGSRVSIAVTEERKQSIRRESSTQQFTLSNGALTNTSSPPKPVTDVPPRVAREIVVNKGRLQILIHPGEVTLRGDGLSNTGRRIRTQVTDDGRRLPYVGGSSALVGVQCARPTITSQLSAETRAIILLQKHVRAWLCRRAFKRRMDEQRQSARERRAQPAGSLSDAFREASLSLQRRREGRLSRARDWAADQDEVESEPELTMELGDPLLRAAEETRLAAKALQEEVDRQMELALSGVDSDSYKAPRMVVVSNKMPLPDQLLACAVDRTADGTRVLSLLYDPEKETTDTIIQRLLECITVSGTYSRVKSLAFIVPCEPGVTEIIFGKPITDVKLFKDESLQRMLLNIGRIVSKVDRAESRIHFIGSGYLAGGERGPQLLTAFRKFSNVTTECPIEVTKQGVDTLAMYLDVGRYKQWQKDVIRERQDQMGLLLPEDSPSRQSSANRSPAKQSPAQSAVQQPPKAKRRSSEFAKR